MGSINDTYEAFQAIWHSFYYYGCYQGMGPEAAQKLPVLLLQSSLVAAKLTWKENWKIPDGRPGVAVLLFAATAQQLESQVVDRVGQCVMTCPTTACFNGLASPHTINVEESCASWGRLASSKLIGSSRYWRIPVWMGNFGRRNLWLLY